MWKSEDEESNLFESDVNWVAPTAMPVSVSNASTPSTSNDNISAISPPPRNQIPPFPPPSPFSALFPQELLQSSGLLLMDGDIVNSDPGHSDRNEDGFPDVEENGGKTIPSAISGVHRCTECKFSSDDRKLLIYHKRSKHAGEKIFSCHDCSAKFTRQYSLKKHVAQKHSLSSQLLPKYCSYPSCKFSSRNSSSMQLHKRSHQLFYFCKECSNVRYSKRQSLLAHLTKHHGSNAALIGMGPSPTSITTSDDQSLQSPPPQASSDVSTIPKSAIYQQCDISNADQEMASVFPSQDDNLSSIGTTKYSPHRLSNADVTSQTIDDVIGSVVAAPEDQSDPIFSCDKCHFTAGSIRRLYGHKLSSHRRPKEKLIAKTSHHICPQCPRKFASLKRMLTHVKKIHTTAMKKRRTTRGTARNGHSGNNKGGKRSKQKRQTQQFSLACDRCDFTTSSNRIYAAHMKSHLSDHVERNQDTKGDSSFRKSIQPNTKRPSPDWHLNFVPSTLPVPSSPNHPPAQSPGIFDFYHNGACARQSGSGSSTYSNASISHNMEPIPNVSIGQFFVTPHRGGTLSTSSASSDPVVNTRPVVRLDLVSQDPSGLEEMTSCVQGLQQANGALMQLLRRRENELSSLRSNVFELLRLLLPNHQAFHNTLSLSNVDEIVSNALNRALNDAASQK